MIRAFIRSVCKHNEFGTTLKKRPLRLAPSSAALSKRLFSKDAEEKTPTHDDNKSSLSNEWIPPNRPLSGDQGFFSPPDLKGEVEVQQRAKEQMDEALFVIQDDDTEEDIQRKLEAALKLEESLEEEEFQKELEREESLESKKQNVPSEPSVDWLATRRAALGARKENSTQAIPVVEHKLLDEHELLQLLEFHRGIDVAVLRDDPEAPRMGGADGMVICEAQGGFHVQSITRALVDHLKERKLNERGVLGAEMGSNRSLYNSNWNVVDCQNFIVHIMDGPTRYALRLEDLWTGRDPLWKLDISDESSVDEYVSQYPVPRDYGLNPQALEGIGKLERNQFAPHTPVVPGRQKQQDRRAGRRRRREMKEGYL